MADGSLARRYARALVELGQEAHDADGFGRELGRFVATVDQEDGLLRKVLSNPGLTTLERRGVLDAVLARLALQPMVTNFLKLLVDKNRFTHLDEILLAYQGMADQLSGRVRATVSTARVLSDSTADRVRATLATSTGKQVILEQRVDPELLGGMVVRLGDTVYDASIRARLASIEDALLRPAGQA